MTVTTALRRLAVSAPEAAVNAAIAATGVADGYVTHDSALGTLFVAANERGVSAIDLADSPQDFEERFAHIHGRPAVAVDHLPGDVERHLDGAIAGGRPGRLPLDLSGLTEFQRAVLLKTAEIPSGEVRPYGWVAREIGRPGAVRAVGSALARNPVPVVVPCHRVVRSDGRLGNYSLGDAENKRRLLAHEGLPVDDYEALAGRGIRFVASDTTGVYCHPTCRHARRITPSHRIEFRDARAADGAGYRPCRVCRPAAAA